MHSGTWIGWLGVVVLLVMGLTPVACAQDAPASDAAEAPADAKPKPDAEAAAAAAAQMRHITVNREAGYLDVAGNVCLDAGPLELAVTLTGGKEHESVFTIKARPQNVHLALLMLGAASGSPGRWVYEDKVPRPIDPTGSKVAVSVVLTDADGKATEKPIAAFIRNMKTKEPLPGSVFLFAGSQVFVDPTNDQRVYMADQTGEVISLVSFEGELLAWPTSASDANDQLEWEVNPDTTPEVGTAVTIRLRPVKAIKPDAVPDKTPDK